MYRLQMLAFRLAPIVFALVGCAKTESVNIEFVDTTPWGDNKSQMLEVIALTESIIGEPIDLSEYTIHVYESTALKCPYGSLGCHNGERQSIGISWAYERDGMDHTLTQAYNSYVLAHEALHAHSLARAGNADHDHVNRAYFDLNLKTSAVRQIYDAILGAQ